MEDVAASSAQHHLHVRDHVLNASSVSQRSARGDLHPVFNCVDRIINCGAGRTDGHPRNLGQEVRGASPQHAWAARWRTDVAEESFGNEQIIHAVVATTGPSHPAVTPVFHYL